MYNKFHLAAKYLRYYFTASNGKGHGMHSPFVFEFITKVLNDRKEYLGYNIVEDLRKKMLNDETVLTVEDFGAGSVISKTNERSISSIAKNAAKPKKYGQLLYRMIKKYQPQTILELGTSLGITTSYLSLAKPDAKIITLEGSGSIASVAEKNFKNLNLENIQLTKGNFDNTLSPVIGQLSSINFAFIDGNHRQEPTQNYFHQILPHINNNSILIFDDIHWSKEMEAAWQNIKEHEAVRCTIDLFFIGIVLFRQEFKAKQHFKIRF
ncbi:MAG: class I SAM-dependent methyltransferase [Chitinophagaceae bacterium]